MRGYRTTHVQPHSVIRHHLSRGYLPAQRVLGACGCSAWRRASSQSPSAGSAGSRLDVRSARSSFAGDGLFPARSRVVVPAAAGDRVLTGRVASSAGPPAHCARRGGRGSRPTRPRGLELSLLRADPRSAATRPLSRTGFRAPVGVGLRPEARAGRGGGVGWLRAGDVESTRGYRALVLGLLRAPLLGGRAVCRGSGAPARACRPDLFQRLLEPLRRRLLAQLNRGETRHALAREVFHGRRGELRQPYHQGQEEQLTALGLVVNWIALYNTYAQRALDHLTPARHVIRATRTSNASDPSGTSTSRSPVATGSLSRPTTDRAAYRPLKTPPPDAAAT